MAISSAPLPPELLIVEEAYQAALRPPDADMKRCIFIVKLGEAALIYRNSNDKKIKSELVKHWLRHWQFTLEYEGLAPLLIKNMDACIEHIANDALADYCGATADRKILIATLCIQRIFLLKTGSSYTTKAQVLELLNALTLRASTNSTTAGIRSVTTFLFGEIAWQLYRNDVEWPGHMVKLLWRNQVPLLSAKVEPLCTTELPEDLV